MQIYPDTVWAWVWASLLKIYIFHMEIEIHCLQSLSRLVFILWVNVEFANNTTLNAIAYRRARAPTTSNSSSTSSNRGGSNINILKSDIDFYSLVIQIQWKMKIFPFDVKPNTNEFVRIFVIHIICVCRSATQTRGHTNGVNNTHVK